MEGMCGRNVSPGNEMIDAEAKALREELARLRKEVAELPKHCRVERVGLYIMVFIAMIGGCDAETAASKACRELAELKAAVVTLQTTLDNLADREAHVERKGP